MDYTLFPDHKKFFAKYLLSDDENYIFTDKLQFLVMDLRQIGAATEAQKEQGLVEWANAFNAKSWDEVEKIQNSGVKEAVNTMQVIMANPKERDMIRRREDALNDWVTQINAASREGAEKKAIEMARGLKRDGVDPAIIARNSGLSIEEVIAL
jgi:predicted transposase/invertase (TIGR01784 family)